MHRTFNSNYAFKFSLTETTTKGVSIYKTGIESKYGNQLDSQLDPASTFIFAKEGEKIKSIERGGGFYIKNYSGQDCFTGNKLSYFNDCVGIYVIIKNRVSQIF
jgi:hypothetical protein